MSLTDTLVFHSLVQHLVYKKGGVYNFLVNMLGGLAGGKLLPTLKYILILVCSVCPLDWKAGDGK